MLMKWMNYIILILKIISKINLYGAYSKYDIHRDCIYNFDGIRFYGIIIGLTDGMIM